jgi:hypothetical protein
MPESGDTAVASPPATLDAAAIALSNRSVGFADGEDLANKTPAVVIVAVGIYDRGLTKEEFPSQFGWKPKLLSAFIGGELDLFSWEQISEDLAPFGKKIRMTRAIAGA